MNGTTPTKTETTYFLTQLLGTDVFLNEKKIGKLGDFVIVDGDKIAEVVQLYIHRPFGDPPLLIPWDRVKVITPREVIIDIDNPEQYVREPSEGQILLKDYVLDKKILDIEGKEVEVVYDVKLILRDKLYVSEVDLSRYGFLKRIGLRRLSRLTTHTETGVNGMIPWAYIQPLPHNIGSFEGEVRLKVMKDKISDIPPVDLADIIEELDQDQRLVLFRQLETEHASDTLEEINPNVQRELISSLDKKHVAALINEMTPGQAADILGVLPWHEVKPIIQLIDHERAKKIQAIIEFHEEKVIHFSTVRYIAVPPDMTVGQAQDEYPKLAKNKFVVMYLYVVDSEGRLLGVIDIRELLKADDTARLKDIMVEDIVSLKPSTQLKEAASLFIHYGFRAIPVVDEQNRLVGVVSYRDVMNLSHYFI
jgi:CBS domain-containing protein